MTTTDAKGFLRCVLHFLNTEIKDKLESSDAGESLEVAIQCLETVFGLPSSNTITSNDLPVDLFQLYKTSCMSTSEETKHRSESFKNEGNRLMKENKHQEAIRFYNKAIEIDPKNPILYCNRAAAWFRLGNFDQTIEDGKYSLILDPMYGKAYARIGLAYSKLKRYPEAINAYERALELEPMNPDYKNNLDVTRQAVSSANDDDVNEAFALAAAGIQLPGLPPGSAARPAISRFISRMMVDPDIRNAMQVMSQSGFPGLNVNSFSDAMGRFANAFTTVTDGNNLEQPENSEEDSTSTIQEPTPTISSNTIINKNNEDKTE